MKIGSNVLTRADGTLNVERIKNLVEQVSALKKQGIQVIMVSSGAVASGRNLIKPKRKDAVSQRQLWSAIGQVRLMETYAEYFKKHGLLCAQILASKDNFSNRKRYLNMRNCVEVLLESNVVPIVNENDTVAVTELMFTDNDELSGLMVSLVDGDALFILSNIDGIFNGSPDDPSSEVIREVEPSEKGVSRFISANKSSFGRGGMLTKFNIARKVARDGIPVHIINGTRDNILTDLLIEKEPIIHTTFIASSKNSGVKKWLGHSESFAKGQLVINEGAVQVLFSKKANSLLLVGVTGVEGEFEKGDIVRIVSEDGSFLGQGKSEYGSEFVAQNLEAKGKKPVIHYNYLWLNE